MRQFIQISLFLLGGLLFSYTVFLALRVNFSLGVVLPGILGLPLLLSGFFFRFLLPENSHGIWRLIKYLLIGGYSLALVFILIACLLITGQLSRDPDPQSDALVVLGAGLYGDRVSATLALRLDAAYDFWQQHPSLPIVVTGGQGPDEWIPEAEAMADYLVRRGVPEEKILLENLSTSTYENLANARDLIISASLNQGSASGSQKASVIVVTSGYHLYRAIRIAGSLDLNASGIGAPVLWYLLPSDLLRETLAITRFYLLGY